MVFTIIIMRDFPHTDVQESFFTLTLSCTHDMIRALFFVAMLMLWPTSAVSAQTAIKVLRFDNGTGVIDHGEDADIHLGEIFEVNRYEGDFVYWVGRVKVYIVRPKIAGIKLLAKAENATIQKGDVLELQRSEYDPMLDKLDAKRAPQISAPPSQAEAEKKILPITGGPQRGPIRFNVMTGGLYSLPGASRSMGMNMALQITNSSNRVIAEIDMSRAYTNGLALQAGLALPLSTKFSLDLNYAYLALRLRKSAESQLLRYGLKGSASLVQIGGVVNYRFAPRWEAGLGTGLYLPQVKVEGNRQSASLSDRQWGWMLALARLFPLNKTVWLKATLAYNLFLDKGPAIHFFALQIGPSFAIGR